MKFQFCVCFTERCLETDGLFSRRSAAKRLFAIVKTKVFESGQNVLVYKIAIRIIITIGIRNFEFGKIYTRFVYKSNCSRVIESSSNRVSTNQIVE